MVTPTGFEPVFPSCRKRAYKITAEIQACPVYIVNLINKGEILDTKKSQNMVTLAGFEPVVSVLPKASL